MDTFSIHQHQTVHIHPQPAENLGFARTKMAALKPPFGANCSTKSLEISPSIPFLVVQLVVIRWVGRKEPSFRLPLKGK
jgi:hypothetical protein